jgi:hypothetical protein
VALRCDKKSKCLKLFCLASERPEIRLSSNGIVKIIGAIEWPKMAAYKGFSHSSHSAG